ncbi:hypothetical protein MKZ38_008743 [Zalerion maritima]|uniref:Uncharacterized protein n=1 Tax=Zalerion maritima TaxID=339359 RepID=A0AAD5RH34_9PEZI|nr:hypothetical protein MKZ38_008743 [Zalerion maritima]
MPQQTSPENYPPMLEATVVQCIPRDHSQSSQVLVAGVMFCEALAPEPLSQYQPVQASPNSRILFSFVALCSPAPGRWSGISSHRCPRHLLEDESWATSDDQSLDIGSVGRKTKAKKADWPLTRLALAQLLQLAAKDEKGYNEDETTAKASAAWLGSARHPTTQLHPTFSATAPSAVLFCHKHDHALVSEHPFALSSFCMQGTNGNDCPKRDIASEV